MYLLSAENQACAKGVLMFFDINNKLSVCDTAPDKNYIAIIPSEKAYDYDIINQYLKHIPILFTDFHFSKIEIYQGFLYGYIRIPEILQTAEKIVSFIYTPDYIIFIDRDNFVKDYFEKLIELHKEYITDSGMALYQLLDYITTKDLEKINALHQNLARLELDILSDKSRNLIVDITNFRSRTLRLHHYYVQLYGICGDLIDNSQNFFSEETKTLLGTFQQKIDLLGHQSEQIWEYTSQLRDIYQQQLEVHQNGIMKFLTIVTTIFMPLTLIAGWYGMNFKYMPELGWKYGYAATFIFSAIIVIILCLLFRKRGWW